MITDEIRNAVKRLYVKARIPDTANNAPLDKRDVIIVLRAIMREDAFLRDWFINHYEDDKQL